MKKKTPSNKSGLQRLNALMNALPEAQRSKIVDNLKERDPRMAQIINIEEESLNAILNLKALHLQKLFKAIQRLFWLKALKIAEPEVKEHLLSHLSARARADLEDDLRALGPVRLKDAQAASIEIMKVANKMERDGEISGLKHDPNDPWV